MRASSAVVRFALSWLFLSVLLGWLLWTAPDPLSPSIPYSLRNCLFLVPVTSAVIAARGFPWRRKAAYASLTFLVFLLVDASAVLGGVQRIPQAAPMSELSPLAQALWIGYITFVYAYPLAVFAFFVGKKPARLWSKDGR